MEPHTQELDIMTDLKHRLRKEMTGTNVAVLSTTDIVTTSEPRTQKYLRLRDGVEEPNESYGLKAQTTDESGHVTSFWTTGVLEMALAMGFTVWIVSTRKAVGPHDWWTKLVPGMQTIMHGPLLGKVWKSRILKHFADRIDEESLEELEGHLRGDDSGDGTYNTYTTVPFIVWALLAQLEWPLLTWEDSYGTKRAQPEFWTGGLVGLAAQGLVVRSPFFHKQMEATNDEIIAECKAVIRANSGHVVDGPNIRNGTCIDCGCASGECEC